MRIGLIDVDGHNYPNLALMKLSAHHKAMGDSVEWYTPWTDRYDRVYASKVFSFTPDYDLAINADEVIRGGTGYAIKLEGGREVYHAELDKPLPLEVEHTFPDYSIYPNYCANTAYGFLTRGCPRGCAFCHVAGKEGRRSVKVADVSEFWNGQKEIVLNDPNILACKEWPDLLAQLAETGARIDFNQGLDIRIMTEDKALAIKRLKVKEVHFAWDRYEDKDLILPKLQLYADIVDFRPHAHKAIVYTLVNHSTTIEQDLERIYTLRDMGYWPYVMIYDKANCKDVYTRLQRWVNNRFVFAKCERFENYKKVSSGPAMTQQTAFNL